MYISAYTPTKLPIYNPECATDTPIWIPSVTPTLTGSQTTLQDFNWQPLEVAFKGLSEVKKRSEMVQTLALNLQVPYHRISVSCPHLPLKTHIQKSTENCTVCTAHLKTYRHTV